MAAVQPASTPPPPVIMEPPSEAILPPPPSVITNPPTEQAPAPLFPPPPAIPPGKRATPPNPSVSTKSHKGILVAGGVIGGVVFVVVVAALVVFFVRRRRRHGGGSKEALDAGGWPVQLFEGKEKEDSASLGELKQSKEVKKETLNLVPLPSPLAPASQKVLSPPDSQLHSSFYSNTSTSSSVSAADNIPLVSVGIRAFTYQQLSHATNQFSGDKIVGHGGFGSVFLGVLSGDGGGDVAIKQLQTGSLQGEREFLTEINVISRVHHRNLVSLVGYCISGTERLLVYEYVHNNSLSFHLHDAMHYAGTTTPFLDWPTRMSVALGTAKGIAYLHEECKPRIIHRDIKSTNILLDSDFEPKVADFGIAKFVPDDKTHVTTRVMGSFGYLAPEFGSSGRLTEKSDVFSFGVVLLELITGRQPIHLVEWASPLLDQALEDGKFETEFIDPKLADTYNHEDMNRMVTCAAICIHRFPDHRPRMSQVVHVLEGNISPEKLKLETNRSKTSRRSA